MQNDSENVDRFTIMGAGPIALSVPYVTYDFGAVYSVIPSLMLFAFIVYERKVLLSFRYGVVYKFLLIISTLCVTIIPPVQYVLGFSKELSINFGGYSLLFFMVLLAGPSILREIES